MTFEYLDKWKNPETGGWCKHVYLLDGKRATGVTTVLSVIAKPALIQWSADMAVEYIAEHIGEAFTYPLEAEKFKTLLAEARVAHTNKKEAAGKKGTDTHAEIEAYIKKCIAKNNLVHPADSDAPEYSAMCRKFIEWAVNNNVKFLASEKKVFSEEWFCAGTFDFSFEKDGKRFIGDLKTMGKIWDNVPHWQAAAYRKMSIEMGEPDYDGTCIVNISKPSEKYPSKLTESWSYDFETNQKAFESCLTLYRLLNN